MNEAGALLGVLAGWPAGEVVAAVHGELASCADLPVVWKGAGLELEGQLEARFKGERCHLAVVIVRVRN